MTSAAVTLTAMTLAADSGCHGSQEKILCKIWTSIKSDVLSTQAQKRRFDPHPHPHPAMTPAAMTPAAVTPAAVTP